MRHILCRAPAKLNLLLKVLGKRTDGYHEIYSLIQAINIFDEITFRKVEAEGVSIQCSDPAIPTGEDNLISKAYRLMKARYAFRGGLDVTLDKKIPSGSGLGGGSSDCATAIMAIDELFGLLLKREEMSGLGALIGSDVPFFFSTGSALVRGRGEIVEDVDLPLDYSVLVVFPNVSISTREVYAGLRIDLTRKDERDRFLLNRDKFTPADLRTVLQNDLGESAYRCSPETRKAGEKLIARGFEYVSMTGSGSAVFALLPASGAGDRELSGFGDWGDWRLFSAEPIRLEGAGCTRRYL